MNGLTETPTALHAVDEEKIVLGAMLYGNKNIVDPLEIFEMIPNERDFYYRRHQLIYRAMLAVSTVECEPTDLLTISRWLEQSGDLAKAGNKTYLAELQGGADGVLDAPRHAKVVMEKALRRRAADTGDKIKALASDPTKSADDILSSLFHEAQNLSSGHFSDSLCHISDMTDDLKHQIDDFQSGRADLHLVPTGLTDLDKLIGGFHPGQMIVVGGLTGEGKTSLALQIALEAANAGKAAMIFSLEMRPIELIRRSVCAEAQVDSRLVIRKDKLTPKDMDRLERAITRQEGLPLYFDGGFDKSIPAISAKIQRFQAQKPLGLVVIDYIQQIQPHKKGDTKATEISYITRDIKRMALNFNVPIIAISQLSRTSAVRQDKTPVLSDLKESSSIEQDADFVLFVARRGSSTKESTIHVSKNRNGACGKVDVYYDRVHTRFANLYGDRA